VTSDAGLWRSLCTPPARAPALPVVLPAGPRAGWCATCAQLLDAAAAAAGHTLLVAVAAAALDTTCRVVANSCAAGAT